MIKDLVEHLDHDLAKGLDPDTAEEPEFAEELLEELCDIVDQHVGD